MPRRHLLGHRHDDERDERDWRARSGVYRGLAPDDDDDEQIRPGWWREGAPPPAAGLTHHVGSDGIRLREAGDDGD